MRAVPQDPTLISAFKNNPASDVGEQATYQPEERFQPDHGPAAANGRWHNGQGATTVSMMRARIAGATLVRFGDHLQDICEDLAFACGRPGGPTLTWSAAEAYLPINAATTFGLIADLLITNAYVHGFPPGRGGRIDASFTVDDDIWALMIDDSGIPIQPPADRRCDVLTIAQQAVRHHAGWIDTPRMTGGTRCIVTIPRSMRASFLHAVPAPAPSVPSWPGRTKLIEAVVQARLAIPAPVAARPPNGTPTALAAAGADDDGVAADAAGR